MSEKREFTLIYTRDGVDEDDFVETLYAEIGGDIECLIGIGDPERFAVEIIGELYDLVSAAETIKKFYPDLQLVELQEETP